MARINATIGRFPRHEEIPPLNSDKPATRSTYRAPEDSFSLATTSASFVGAELTTDPEPPPRPAPEMRDDYRSGENDRIPQTEADILRDIALTNGELDRLMEELFQYLENEAGTDQTLKDKIAAQRGMLEQARRLEDQNRLLDVQIAHLNGEGAEAQATLQRTEDLLDAVNGVIEAGDLTPEERTALNEMKSSLEGLTTELTNEIGTLAKQADQLRTVKVANTQQAQTLRTDASLLLEDITALRDDLPELRGRIRELEGRRTVLNEQLRRLHDIDNDGILNESDLDADGDHFNRWTGEGDPLDFDHFDYDANFRGDLDMDGLADEEAAELDVDGDGYSIEGSSTRPPDANDRDREYGEDRDRDGLDDRIERGEARWVYDDQGNRTLVQGGHTWAGVKNRTEGDDPGGEGDPRPEPIGGTFNSDPNRKDTDGDGLDDLAEYLNFLGPHGNSTDPRSEDTDSDGIWDKDEIEGVTDQSGRRIRTNPNNFDTDGDGLSDLYEINTSHTNPLNRDTDGDGVSDGEEANNGGNPVDNSDHMAFPGGVTPESTGQTNYTSDAIPMTADGKIDVSAMTSGQEIIIEPTNDDFRQNIKFQFNGIAQIDYDNGDIVVRFNPPGNGQDIRTVRIKPGPNGRFERDFFFYGVGGPDNNAVFKTNDFDRAMAGGVIAEGRIQVNVNTASDFVGGRGRDAWWRAYRVAHPDEDLPEHQPWEDSV